MKLIGIVVDVVVVEVAGFGCCRGRLKEVLFVLSAILENRKGTVGFNCEGERRGTYLSTCCKLALNGATL